MVGESATSCSARIYELLSRLLPHSFRGYSTNFSAPVENGITRLLEPVLGTLFSSLIINH